MFERSVGALLIAAGGVVGSGVAAHAQGARDAEILGFHQLCGHGDRRACVRFGMLLQQNQDRRIAWRRLHPEWFWWDR
jgi:hypothetical protein